MRNRNEEQERTVEVFSSRSIWTRSEYPLMSLVVCCQTTTIFRLKEASPDANLAREGMAAAKSGKMSLKVEYRFVGQV